MAFGHPCKRPFVNALLICMAVAFHFLDRKLRIKSAQWHHFDGRCSGKWPLYSYSVLTLSHDNVISSSRGLISNLLGSAALSTLPSRDSCMSDPRRSYTPDPRRCPIWVVIEPHPACCLDRRLRWHAPYPYDRGFRRGSHRCTGPCPSLANSMSIASSKSVCAATSRSAARRRSLR